MILFYSLTQLDVGYIYDEPGKLTNHRFVCHLHLLRVCCLVCGCQSVAGLLNFHLLDSRLYSVATWNQSYRMCSCEVQPCKVKDKTSETWSRAKAAHKCQQERLSETGNTRWQFVGWWVEIKNKIASAAKKKVVVLLFWKAEMKHSLYTPQQNSQKIALHVTRPCGCNVYIISSCTACTQTQDVKCHILPSGVLLF